MSDLNALFQESAHILCLDAPARLEFGVDMKSWETGPKFQGVKLIPEGIHCIHYRYDYVQELWCTFFTLLRLSLWTCNAIVVSLSLSGLQLAFWTKHNFFLLLLLLFCSINDRYGGAEGARLSFFIDLKPQDVRPRHAILSMHRTQ
jgi:hypothetical protein